MWLIIRINTSPAVGHIQTGQPGPERFPSADTTPHSLNGKYLSFTYPSAYRPVPTQPNGGRLEVINLIAASGKEIAISVSKSSLAEDSGVRFRRLNASLYSEEPLRLARHSGVVFTKRDEGFEKTAFAVKGELLVTLALSHASGGDYSDEFNAILDSLVLK
ncbi:hypothetical protein KY386_03855 [Candidatus Parcubacteria bacterium]|nr:hypothetical protein [Candidatus Parcubacteria bacterium]